MIHPRAIFSHAHVLFHVLSSLFLVVLLLIPYLNSDKSYQILRMHHYFSESFHLAISFVASLALLATFSFLHFSNLILFNGFIVIG